MPKLAEAIRRSQRVETAPMGFGAARPAPKPSMLVGFLAPPSMVAAARDAGADLIIIEADVSAADAAKQRTAAGDLPLGVHPNAIDAATAKALQSAGIDFLVFDADTTPAAALLEEDLGYVLRLPEAPSEDFLRSIDSLSLE
ncbi:MAG TPA: hypothetical protein VI759_00920, partial [Dehalococcoidia bacterium]|nr:hypothetical protein [Dehalococcoidia bacterium]